MAVAKEQIRQIISENNISSVADVYSLLKESFKDILQELMEAELDASLGKELYISLLLTEKLYPHLLEIDKTANERMDILMQQLMKAAGVTEELKAADQMKWVGLVNNCKAQAEETILHELIYN